MTLTAITRVAASVNTSSFRFSKRLNRSSLQNNWLFGIVAMKSTHSMADNRIEWHAECKLVNYTEVE
ncbi:hypothetical protein H5410_005858 [Solanum commersonii]|uniref:Uncharacterized protein n=1 Tax=Solanum commersonii TaxID=4109 RepID=A0A9J6A899_SOLCO|nr:hypothetical protein H5410_005858 [Solanum commersonii]